MPETDIADPLQPHLMSTERLAWSQAGSPVVARKAERWWGVASAGVLALIVTTLAHAEDWVQGFMLPLLFVAVFLVSLAGSRVLTRATAGQPGHYGITDRRVLVLEASGLRAFEPADIGSFEVERHPDGSVDLYWGMRTGPRLDSRHNQEAQAGASMKFLMQRRADRVGLIGLPALEPAHTLLRDLLQKHHGLAEATAVAPVPGPTNDEWQTMREPDTGVAIDVPGAWQARVGVVRRSRVLGVRIESPQPRWFDAPGAGWNRLEVRPGGDEAVLQMDLEPPDPPADLAAASSDKWSALLNVRLLETHPDVHTQGFSGFGVTQGLKGAGMGAGGIRLGESLRSDLVQTQLWLRAGTRSVHLVVVTPAAATALRERMQAVIASLRLEGAGRKGG
ncbi:MAG: hypothetical protein ACLGG8_05780 [Gammaproteobacteria bacterium]